MNANGYTSNSWLTALLTHPARVTGRLVWLAAELLILAFDYLFRVPLRPRHSLLQARARWLQRGCRRVLRIFNADVRASGPIPGNGLLVSNHLSYLDILVLSSLTPAVFVAKREVQNWPVFGWFARLAGTLFADRTRRSQVSELSDAIRRVLEKKTVVILFPEGTSSDGQAVLPFKSALLEPAVGNHHPLSATLIEYHLEDGDVGEEVCYWKNMTLVPHLVNLLSKQRVEVSVRFSASRNGGVDRKRLARETRAEILRMKALGSAFASRARTRANAFPTSDACAWAAKPN